MVGVKYLLEYRNISSNSKSLGKDNSDTLTEESPMNLIYRDERKESSVLFPEFTPPDSGIYSVTLQVTDKANNSEFARKITIYYPNSTMTTTEENNFYVLSAEKESEYKWQS